MLPILNGLAALAAVAVSLFARNTLPLPANAGRAAGSVLVLGGLAFVLWATAHLGTPAKSEPRGRLVTTGPYRLVRHPIYFGLAAAIAGVALTGRSAAGLAALLLLYVPTAWMRARSEESALAGRFGRRWLDWAGRTPLLPGWRSVPEEPPSGPAPHVPGAPPPPSPDPGTAATSRSTAVRP